MDGGGGGGVKADVGEITRYLPCQRCAFTHVIPKRPQGVPYCTLFGGSELLYLISSLFSYQTSFLTQGNIEL